MTRAYTITPPGSGPAPPGPRPQSMQPRAGVQVVRKKPPRVGKSAAELDGVTLPPPIDLGGGKLEASAFNGAREQSHIQLETFSTETARIAQGNGRTEPALHCFVCEASESTDVLIHLAKMRELTVCGSCVERMVDALRTELPRRRLRLAMERMLAGQVTPEMVAEVERLSGGKDGPT